MNAIPGSTTQAPRRVTVVAFELRGFLPVGGMGTATTFLALALARMGHSVELLLGNLSVEAIDPYWGELYAEAGIRLRSAPQSEECVEPAHFADARSVELGLLDEPPDVVIGHDLLGPLYSALRVRQAGIAFDNTLFVVFCHGGKRYIMDVSRNVGVKGLEHLLAVGLMEQASVELADVVVSPSAYLLDWMRSVGWQLPERSHVIPYFTRSTATGEPAPRAQVDGAHTLRRLAFFGRLDERKGLAPFAAGLNALEPELLETIALEFIGKTTTTWPRERIEALLSPATRQALRAVGFETRLDQHEALERLLRPGTLVVMPSLQDNSPNAVYECLEHGIPFIASDVGGVPELIVPGDRGRVLFEPTPAGIEAALRRVFGAGDVPPPVSPAYAATAPFEGWAEVIGLRPTSPRPRADDRVDVVVVRRSSPGEPAGRCVSALERQSYSNFNVIGCEGPSVEAARTAGLQAGSADYVIFLDEDDLPDEALITTLVQARTASDADVVTCGLRLQRENGEHSLHFFMGEPGGLGVLSNAYGNVGLFRRDVLGAMTAFGAPLSDPDWPLLASLNAKGSRIVSVPAPLVARSAPPGSVQRNPGDTLVVLEQLERVLPDAMRSTARLAAGLAANPATPPARLGIVRRLAERLLPGAR